MRKKKRGAVLFGGLALAMAVLAGGCGPGTAVEETEDRQLPTVTVGCDDYAPFSYMDMNGNVTGIDVELATEAFHRMGYEPEFSFINWEDKKDLLEAGTIDCIWSSFTMDGREEEYKWAGPYMKSNQVIAVRVDSPIQTLQDLEGKTIAVQSTTKPEDLFREHAASIPAFRKVISVKNRDLLYTFLSKGYVDAIAAHDTSIEQFMEDFHIEYRILDEPLLAVNLGVAFDKTDDRGLAETLSQTLGQMRADGTIKEILSGYVSNAEQDLEDANEE